MSAPAPADDTDYPRPCARQFMFDGWYANRSWAEDVLSHIASLDGASAMGIVESEHGTWGLLYTSDRVWFDNHLVADWAMTGRQR